MKQDRNKKFNNHQLSTVNNEVNINTESFKNILKSLSQGKSLSQVIDFNAPITNPKLENDLNVFAMTNHLTPETIAAINNSVDEMAANTCVPPCCAIL